MVCARRKIVLDRQKYDLNATATWQVGAYLTHVTVKEEKAIATAFGIAHAGNKKVRAARIYVTLTGIMEREGKSAKDILEAKGAEVGGDFVTGFHDLLDIWCEDAEEKEVPSISELENQSGI